MAPRIRFLPNDPLEPARLEESVPWPDVPQPPPRAVVSPEGGAPPPPPGAYARGTRAFRHWQLSEALRRGVRVWSALAPGFTHWQAGRDELPARPDGGEELNAWYDREALVFCHVRDPRRRKVVFASESVDVACHEEAHAVLDALRPDLWDAAAFEAAAFHEAFGDVGALLVALDDPALRAAALRETRGDPRASSVVSRLAEQLGQAARDLYGAEAAPPNCLREAANDFTYRPPLELPAAGPDSELTREPHSFSRVFTGVFHEAVARAARAAGAPVSVAALGVAAAALGGALARAAARAPLTSHFYASVARAWLAETGRAEPFAGSLAAALAARRLAPAHALDAPTGPATVCVRRADGEVTCFAAHAGAGEEAAAFLEDLALHGRLEGGPRAAPARGARATHRIERRDGRVTLRRIRFLGG